MDISAFEKVAPFLTHPLVLVGFGLFLVFSIHFAVVRLQKRSTQATRKILTYGFIIALVLMVLGFGLSFYQISRAPDVYRVRLTVLHPDGTVVEDAKLTSSVGGELKAGPGGVWELEIPASARPADGKVQIFATRRALTGSVELLLGEDFRPPAVTVPLARQEVSVRGSVVDPSNQLVAGVRVSVDGYPDEAVVTAEDGYFELPAHVAAGEDVRLRGEKEGYEIADEYVLAEGGRRVVGAGGGVRGSGQGRGSGSGGSASRRVAAPRRLGMGVLIRASSGPE